MSKSNKSLEERVALAAHAALRDHQYVSPIDVLLGIGWLQPIHVQEWRKGCIHNLEEVIQTRVDKISQAMMIFRVWAREQGLVSSHTEYFARTAGPQRELRFSKSGHPSIESSYRTHFVSPELSEKKRENLRKRLSQAPELVVYKIRRDTTCSKCGAELLSGSLLLVEVSDALCMKCSGMDKLFYVPAGSAKLTRGVKKYSSRYAVVVQFSRTRKRYERQGILAEKEAVERAERECETE